MIKKIKKFMDEKNLNQTEMACLLGTTKFTFSRWMNGKNKPSQAYARIIETLCSKNK